MIITGTVFMLILAFQTSAETEYGAPYDEATRQLSQVMGELMTSSTQIESENTSDGCVSQFLASLSNGDKAFKIIDTWGKPEAGLTAGNILWLGRASMCLEIEDQDVNGATFKFSDRLVLLTLNMTHSPKPIPIWWMVCLPESCDHDDTIALISGVVAKIDSSIAALAQVEVVEAILANPGRYDFGFYFAVSVFGILGLVILLATLLDYIIVENKKTTSGYSRMDDGDVIGDVEGHDNEAVEHEVRASVMSNSLRKGASLARFSESFICEIFLAFSLRQNVPSLLSCKQKSTNVQCIDGIRVLSINWVVLGHCLMFTGFFFKPVPPVFNPLQFNSDYASHWTFLAVSNGTFAVDSFFALSGFLLVFLAIPRLPEIPSKLPNLSNWSFWVLFVVRRYIRLVPPLVFMTLFTVGVWKVMGNGIGSMWQPYMQGVTNCERYYWKNLLFISNLGDTAGTTCNGWTWYLSDDFQYYVLSIIPLILYMRWKWAAIVLVFVAIFASTVASFAYSLTEHLGPDLFVGFKNTAHRPDYNSDFATVFNGYYVRPYFRFGAYGVGMLCGFMADKYRHRTNFRFPFIVNCMLWLFSWGIMAAVIFGLAGMLNGHFPSFLTTAFYNALSRPAWALALSFVIFACMQGNGGIINTFLSWKLFMPLAKLTYMVYLLHPLVIIFLVAASETKFLYNNVNYAALYISVLVLTYTLSFFACLMVEYPVVKIEKAIRDKFVSK